MCGILGMYNPKLGIEDHRKKIINTLHISNHRGPDENGTFFDSKNNFSLGMNRLSIVDIENGHQPFFSNDGRYCIIFNGEIVNSEDLKIKLIKKGIKFKTQNSDTEVLLQMLINFGENCLSELNGMFAFCFYDTLKKKILLARDRFGIKPLYFFFEKNNFCFASELKTLLNLYEDELKINHESLSDFISLMYIPAPNTIFKNIYKLQAGEKINFDIQAQKFIKKKWHNHQFKIDNKIDEIQARSQINEITEKAILRWTQSDVQICNSLSGGIDSSVISSILGKNKFNIINFSLGFSNENDALFDEIDLAKKVSFKWKQKHIIKNINSEELISKIDMIFDSIHEPYGGGLPSWLVYEKISQNYKVAFNGTGIDEFFGNYGKWTKLKYFFSKNISFKRFQRDFFDLRYYAKENEKRDLLNFNIENYESTSSKFFKIFNEYEGDVEDKSALLDIKTQLTDEFLQICDNFSMNHSLEVRPAYLDKDLTNYLFTLPSKIRIGKKSNLKKNFKNSFKNILPKEILEAKKRGFILPIENWLKGPMKPFLQKFLSEKKISQHELFNKDIYKKNILPFLNRSKLSSRFDKYHKTQTQIWGLLVFQMWFEKYINKQKIKI